MYQVRLFLMENCTLAQSELYSRFNTTTTNMVLSGLSICAKYEVSIRGYTAVGPGPYSGAITLQTLGKQEEFLIVGIVSKQIIQCCHHLMLSV